MALKKKLSFKGSSKVFVEYHKIRRIVYSDGGGVRIQYASYIDEGDRTAGAPLETQEQSIDTVSVLREETDAVLDKDGEIVTPASVTETKVDRAAKIPAGNVMSQAYHLLKLHEDFADAEDC
jgi:hypothetical protein